MRRRAPCLGGPRGVPAQRIVGTCAPRVARERLGLKAGSSPSSAWTPARQDVSAQDKRRLDLVLTAQRA